MNMVHICGFIGAEPDFRTFENGKRKVSLSIALNQYSKESHQTDTICIPCLAWDTVCDRFLRCREKVKLSGRKINVTGSFVQSKWTDPTNGKKHCKLMVKILLFELLSGAPQEQTVEPSTMDSTQSQLSPDDVQVFFEGKSLNQPRHASSRTKPSS